MGIVGCGAISKQHLEAIRQLPEVSLLAVADSVAARAKVFGEEAGCTSYSDYRSLFDRPDVDAVILATPSGLHAKMALDAFSAGKHVLVEKPMAMSLDDADKMIYEAKRASRILGVVHHNRFNQTAGMLKDLISSGGLGKVVWGSASVKWYRPQDYYSGSGWRGTVSMDGGVLMNQAIHHIDLLLWLAGDAEAVSGFRATLGHEIEAEDTAVIALRFESGALGEIDATTCAFPQNLEETVTIIGDKGSVIIGGNKLDAIRSWNVPEAAPPPPIEDKPKWFGHWLTLKDFAKAVRAGKEPLVGGEEGRRALKLILDVYRTTPITARTRNGGFS